MPSLIWITLSLLFINVYINLDSVLLGLLASPREVGLYNAAIRPCRLAATLLASFSTAAMPRLAYYLDMAEDHVHASRELQNKSFNLLCLLSLPLACAVALSAPVLIPVLYGQKYTDAIPALVYSAPMIVLNGAATFILFQVLLPRGKEYVLVGVAAGGALASLIANMVLIPIWGYNGAVLGALIAETASIFVQLIFIRKFYPGELVIPSQLWKYVVASGGLALTLMILLPHMPNTFQGLLTSWGAAGLVYCGLLWMMRESILHQLVKRTLRYHG